MAYYYLNDINPADYWKILIILLAVQYIMVFIGVLLGEFEDFKDLFWSIIPFLPVIKMIFR